MSFKAMYAAACRGASLGTHGTKKKKGNISQVPSPWREVWPGAAERGQGSGHGRTKSSNSSNSNR